MSRGFVPRALSGVQPKADRRPHPRHSVRLAKAPLLRLTDGTGWTRWFEAAGVAHPVAHGSVLNRASMLIDAAADGQGVALARTTLAAWDLISGRLVIPVDMSLEIPNTYWIVCPKATATTPKIATFRQWLLAEAEEDARRLATATAREGLLIRPRR